MMNFFPNYIYESSPKLNKNQIKELKKQTSCESEFWEDLEKTVSDTPQQLAAEYGVVEVLKDSLKKKKLNKEQDEYYTTLLMRAAKSGNVETLEFLVDQKFSIYDRDSHGRTATMYAIEYSKLEAVQFFCRISKSTVKRAEENGVTPLMKACIKGNQKIATVLLEHGALINSTDDKKDNALTYALTNGHLNLATYLFENGATMDSKTTYLYLPSIREIRFVFQNSPFWSPVYHRTPEFEYLKEENPILLQLKDPNFKLSGGNMEKALHACVIYDRIDVFKEILEIFPDINQVDQDGNSILHLSIIHYKLEMFYLLMKDSRVKLELKNNEQWTPLEIAMKKGNLEAVRSLIPLQSVYKSTYFQLTRIHKFIFDFVRKWNIFKTKFFDLKFYFQ
jgi:ankyrin repeat protein